MVALSKDVFSSFFSLHAGYIPLSSSFSWGLCCSWQDFCFPDQNPTRPQVPRMHFRSLSRLLSTSAAHGQQSCQCGHPPSPTSTGPLPSFLAKADPLPQGPRLATSPHPQGPVSMNRPLPPLQSQHLSLHTGQVSPTAHPPSAPPRSSLCSSWPLAHCDLVSTPSSALSSAHNTQWTPGETADCD